MSLTESTQQLFNQAKNYHRQGRFEEAIHLLNTILERDKNFIDAYLELSFLFHKTNRDDLTQHVLTTALSINPDHDGAILLNADFLLYNKKYDTALQFCDRILWRDPNNFDALSKKALILRMALRYQESLTFYEMALAVKPDDLMCLNNKGTILFTFNQFEEALHCFLTILPHDPQNDLIHANIANCFTALGRYKKALHHYNQSLAINPNETTTITAYANLLSRLGDSAEALTQYSRVLQLAPETAEAHWAHTVLSIIEERTTTTDDVAFENTALTLFKELEHWCRTRPINATRLVGLYQFFRLTYFGNTNNIALLREHGQFCYQLMKAWLDQQKNIVHPSPPNTPVKIGIITADTDNSSVWHAIIKGIIAHLDKSLFEVHLFCLKNPDNEQLAWASQHCKNVVRNIFHIEACVGAIANQPLDIIFYPAIGMDMNTLQLASLRLAPVQIVGWGHPETSGLPSIDYYLSSEAFEPPDAQQYYTETLLMLPHIGTCYTPLAPSSTDVDLAALGVTVKGPILVAPGMALKYQPEYDYLLVEIAKQLKTCTILFFLTRPPFSCLQLKKRLRGAFESANLVFEEYVHFIPWQKGDAFFSLMKQADVFLDSVGFSGFNTAMQAMECGLPIVTKEGRFMRGRFGSGILRYCGLDELVVTTDEDYVQITVKIASDKTYREAIKQKMIESHAMIFDDKTPIKALETLLLGLIKS